MRRSESIDELGRNSLSSVRTLTVAVIVAMLASLVTVGLAVAPASSDVVQGVEVDVAGQQRRLVERLRVGVALLRSVPDDAEARRDLLVSTTSLRSIRLGLLGGSDRLGLDGEIPTVVRDLYAPGGLDFSGRLDRLEESAVMVATAPGPVEGFDADAFDDLGRGLSIDLDIAVEALAAEQDRQDALRERRSIIGLFATCALGAMALATLAVVRRRLHGQIRARAELLAEMADSEELHRTTVDALVDGVVILDEDGGVVRVNESARAIIGRHLARTSQASGERMRGFLPHLVDENGDRLLPGSRPLDLALSGDGPVVDMTIGLPTPDGIVWFRCNAVATADRDDGGRRVVAAFADITVERRLAVELADQERRFRLALEHAPIGMALTSATGSFLTVNGALCRLTGRSSDDLTASDALGLLHPDDRADFERVLGAFAGDGCETASVESRIVAADGSIVDVEVAMAVVRAAADVDRYVIVEFLDVTETRRAAVAQDLALAREQEAVASLVALDEVRSTFVSTVSHELRTPLTSLVGYLELLGDGTVGSLDEQQAGMVEAAVRNGDRLARLIDDLLTMNLAEGSSESERSETVSMSDVVASVLETVSPMAKDGGVALCSESNASSAVVVGDRSELERMLSNIVGNAVKFTPPGGTVRVSSETVGGASPEMIVSVVDTGVGIAADEIDDVFTRFYRSKAAQSSHVQGTGLGLVIASDLAEAHGGRIELESDLGRGTTVRIHLPVSIPASQPVVSGSSASA